MIASLESAGVEVVFVEALTEQRGELDPRLRIQDKTLFVRDGDRWEPVCRGIRADARVETDARLAVLWTLDDRFESALRVIDLRALRELEPPPWAAQVVDVTLAEGLTIALI